MNSRVLLSISAVLLLISCSSSQVAPVTTATPTQVASAKLESPTTTAANPTAHEEKVHVVKAGDTIYSIANQYNVSYFDLALWNNISDFTRLKIGSRLRVISPQKPVEQAMPPAAVTSAISLPGTVRQQDVVPLGAPLGVVDSPKGGKIPYSAQALTNAIAEARSGVSVGAGVGVGVGATAAAITPPAAPPPVTAPSPQSSDQWVWPATGPVLAKYTDSQSTGTKGIDIGGKVGDPVRAAADGKVFYAGSSLAGYGKMIILRHSGDLITVYAQNNKLLVNENQTIKQNQIIAELGGTTTTPLLHFEIRKKGITEDPLKYLPAR